MGDSIPRYIQVTYDEWIEFDLQDLDIDWNEIEDFWIKWGALTCEFKDGTQKEYEPTSEYEADRKRGVDRLFDEDWAEVGPKESLMPASRPASTPPDPYISPFILNRRRPRT